MAASRRGQPELHVRLPPKPSLPAALPDLPPISALFLIDFDVKAGYTITWKASEPGVELEGVVEYKSLPSGLHTVSDDLIYYVHDGYAGLSAFVNAPVEDTEVRNARMLAVGVLVPLSYGRLGRAWRHADGLKRLAVTFAANSKDNSPLEQYWQKHQAQADGQDPTAPKDTLEPPVGVQATPRSQRGHTRNRAASDGTSLIPHGHKLSPYHPAWSLTKLLDTFGPLIFPIHRAALLRKRILIMGHAPVQEICNFVYDISILSNIPPSTYDLLSPRSPPHRLRPLFSIGVHDIPFLIDDSKPARNDEGTTGSNGEAGTGWIACTTDSILSKKDTLWDVLITMPPAHAANAKRHVWPSVEYHNGVNVRATQRDMRRFRALKAGLARIRVDQSPPTSPAAAQKVVDQNADNAYLDEAEQVVEPLSWTALAYNGFMWWASAGEQARADEAEEAAHDNALLADLSAPSMGMPRSADLAGSIASLTPRRTSTSITAALDPEEARVELATIAYFHRLTTQILSVLTDIVESSSDSEDNDDGEESGMEEDDGLVETGGEEDLDGRGVRIGSDAMSRMGLDVWSDSDALFVRELLKTYFERQAHVEGKGVEVCGVKVC
ncbi:hypothetical protein F4778DRAFT_782525 [Xylariomycetidae sp. FL2044]|nr:hypothetical protein F4778DRAFT_782525 [Xylariomycetidae sp. FL2044]